MIGQCDEKESFLSWGGEEQMVYEQWRSIALGGGDVPLFDQKGMSLFARKDNDVPVQLRVVKRVRAPVRAGDFSLKELFSELGISKVMSQAKSKVIGREVYYDRGLVCQS